MLYASVTERSFNMKINKLIILRNEITIMISWCKLVGNLFWFFLSPLKKTYTHYTHLQIALANLKPKFAKECNRPPY